MEAAMKSMRSSGDDSMASGGSSAVQTTANYMYRGKKLKEDEGAFLLHSRFLRDMSRAAADLVDARRAQDIA